MHPYTLDDAERDLRAALGTGERDLITAAATRVDQLDTPRAPVSLHAAALWYAEQGLRVFPLSPGSKIPFKGSRGCLDATSDPAQVDRWWTATPEANIGIATGHLVDVVDIDGAAGQRSRCEHWDDIFARIEDDAIGRVLTPRPGGMHLVVPATGDGNATNIVPHVDYRGVGGYVVAPPSRTDVGSYRWLGALDVTRLGPRSVVA